MKKEKARATDIEKEKRIYQVSLLLRRKPIPFIVEFIRKEWGIETAQAYKYIALAKEEWQKYFSQVKKCGKSYYMSKMRDLYDKALDEEDYRLAVEITREEAKLSGAYEPTEVNLRYAESEEIQLLVEKILKMSDEEIDEYYKRLQKIKERFDNSEGNKKENWKRPISYN